MIIEELKSHLPHHINLIAINIAVHALIAVILALHYAVKQGHKGSVKTVLDSLTPEQRLDFLSTKDKKDESGKTAIQWAPADERKEIDKMLRQCMREADFEVNYGEFVLFLLFSGFGIIRFSPNRYYSMDRCLFSTTNHDLSFDRRSFQTFSCCKGQN